MIKSAGKPRRADAVANREAIIEAAREAFANKGLDASLDGIARAAGVGAGTLYRHFPARADLVAAVLASSVIDLNEVYTQLGEQDISVDVKLERWLSQMRTWMTAFNGLPEPLREAWDGSKSSLGMACTDIIAKTADILAQAQEQGLANPALTGRDLYLANLGMAWALDAPLAGDSTEESLSAILGKGWRN